MMSFVDWCVVIGLLLSISAIALYTRRFSKSVADFLVAGRAAGRYIICVSQDMAGLGAISIIAWFEMYYEAGFTAQWWNMMFIPVTAVIALSGWVIYRYRQTRVLTLAQFFESRYSKRFRVFTGLLSFFSGLLNFAIFPSVGSRFMIYFCGLPETFHVMGIEVSVFVTVMFLLLSISLFFTFAGGQITVIITDFFQGIFVNIAFIIILIFMFRLFSWEQILQSLEKAPENASMMNPFKTSEIKNFNLWYFVIAAFGMFYGVISWQGSQAYNASAKNPHEAKMGNILKTWRLQSIVLLFLFLPICAYVVLHHPDFTTQADTVNATLSTIDNAETVNQLTVPLVLVALLPKGLTGLFCAVMLVAFISTHDTYLHSWGAIFVQDVIMPFRKTPFTPKQHMRLLRISIVGVAIFVFIFSILFSQTVPIYMWFAITGAIFVGGVGIVIIGGLYWKRGTTAAAWSAMITGSTLAVTGTILTKVAPDFFLTGQVMWLISMVASTIVYVIVSLAGNQICDMDKILKRGKYAVETDTIDTGLKQKGWKAMGMGGDFSMGDRIIYISTIIWNFLWFGIFVVGTVYGLIWGIPDSLWAEFWHYYIWVGLAVGVIVTIWFLIGGLKDVNDMFAVLRKTKTNDQDDGMVLSEDTFEK